MLVRNLGVEEMGITTKRGDKGETDLLFGHAVHKTDLRMEVCGTVDELNASLGVARSTVVAPNLKQELLSVQHSLFTIGAEVATKEEDFSRLNKTITENDITRIEEEIGILEQYNDINNWFIPGDSPSSAYLELARTIARRLERHLLRADHHNEHTHVYLNRLSDYLWLLAQKEEYYLRGLERKSTEQVPSTEQQTSIF